MSPKGTKYGVFEVFNPLYVHVSCMSSGVNMIALSHDGELMLMCHMGFTHTNVFRGLSAQFVQRFMQYY